MDETLELNESQRQSNLPTASLSPEVIFPGIGLEFHTSEIIIQYIWGRVHETKNFSRTLQSFLRPVAQSDLGTNEYFMCQIY